MLRFTFSHHWQNKKFTKNFRLGLCFSRAKVVSQVTERQLCNGLVHKSFKTKPRYSLVVNLIFITFGIQFGAKSITK